MATDGVDYAEIRRRVAALRKPELCECLERLNMRKAGNKPDLQRRLLDIFEDSYQLAVNGHPPPRDMFKITSAQRVIDDVYNKMISGGSAVNGATSSVAAPAAAAADTKLGSTSAAPHGHTNGHARTAQSGAPSGNTLAGALDAFLRNQGATARGGSAAAGGPRIGAPAPVVVRCCCGSSSERQPLWQCRATGCGVYQHGQCVGLNPGLRPPGGEFYCELCRAKRADPFWEVEDASITGPIRLSSTNKQVPVPGAVPQFVRSAERTFMLSDQISKKVQNRPSQNTYQLQLVCLQLNDTVPFRFHWPLGASLDVNGVQYRVYSRNAHHKLGANARDEQANIGPLCPTGHNRLSVSGTDNSPYVVLLLLVRKRTMEEVQRLMMPPLSVRDALQRVRHQLRGDDDDEVQTGATVVSLRCPILGGRVRTPGRFSEVPGLATFDLEAFLDSAARTRKWQCPLSMTHSHVHNLQVDTYTQRIIRALAGHPEVMEVEVAADGSWRPAGWRDGFFSIEVEDPLAGRGRGDSGGGGATGASGGGGDDEDDDEEEDEEEELRRAAAAVAANLKRKRAPSPDVIDLASSDDDDEQPPAAGGASTTQQQPAPAAPPPQPAAPVNGARHAAGPAAATGQRHGDGSAVNTTSAPQHQQPPLRIPLQGRVLTGHSSAGAAQPQAATTMAGAGQAQTAMPFLHSLRRPVGNGFGGPPYSTNPMQPQPQQQPQQSHAQQPAQQRHPSAQHNPHQQHHPQQQQQQQQQTSRTEASSGSGGAGGAAQPGVTATAAAATAAGSGGGGGPAAAAGGVSIRQPVTAQARNPIRIQMAATQATPNPPAAAAGSGTARSHETGGMVQPTPGIPVISPYQPSNAGSNTSTAGAGAGVVAVPPMGSVPRWLAGANGALGSAQQHLQQQHAQAPPQLQQLVATTLQHGQQPHWLGLTALGGSGQAAHGQQPQPQPQQPPPAYATPLKHPPPAHYYPGQQQQQLIPQRSGAGAWQGTQQQNPSAQAPQAQAQAQSYHPSQHQKPQQQPQPQSQPQPQQNAAGVAAAVAFYQHHAAAAQQAVQSQLAQRQMAHGSTRSPQGAAGSGAGPPPPPIYDCIEITDSGDED